MCDMAMLTHISDPSDRTVNSSGRRHPAGAGVAPAYPAVIKRLLVQVLAVLAAVAAVTAVMALKGRRLSSAPDCIIDAR
jgi:hypothetical protein